MARSELVPDGFAVPRELVAERFRLEPLGPQHNERDHAAWTSSIEHIRSTPGFDVWDGRPFFHEFVVKCPVPVSEINEYLLVEHDIVGGYDLGKDYRHLKNHMLLCCTETNTRQEIDELVEGLSRFK